MISVVSVKDTSERWPSLVCIAWVGAGVGAGAGARGRAFRDAAVLDKSVDARDNEKGNR
jgi:hypothetical protein